MTVYRFLQPLDLLVLRGNKLFGDPGSFGESLVPPWPSAAAGALRSWLLASDSADAAAFARGEVAHPTLGTPTAPGSFRLTAFHVARLTAAGTVELLIEPPSDLILSRSDDEKLRPAMLAPQTLPAGLLASAPVQQLPVLGVADRRKSVAGYWLNQRAVTDYLQGKLPEAADLIPTNQLWKVDARIGIGLDPIQRRADDGKLFATQAVGFCPGTGFLVGVEGAELPANGSLRFGGDGRAAAVSTVRVEPPIPDLSALASAGRCRLVLTSPGLFPDGWRLPGVDAQGRFALGGVRARLVSAAVPRAQTVSGWDLAAWQPKPAQRAAPSGSVYWLDQLEATPEALGKLVAAGLWREPCDDLQRRAEGFNRFSFAVWT
ncbi:MAG: type III-B CRISPR module-associated Cmr3 family protein [Lamprobacter sp.]|uniref:type III-B CRISPR module-associated Cmr3 family protein n=1 Tax=Lamprobacter sp. TaxID=3100796 RepID=UPI002B2640DF|nr:type III-B CRISPR module-associated Cmr3 family protein [Lamprobacter sp.]MEA3643120.1 type III-B CRISPR module-associated Cmr3 family protein [Lamprobacter sp.]